MIQFKNLEKQEQTKSKPSQWEEKQITVGINEIETTTTAHNTKNQQI